MTNQNQASIDALLDANIDDLADMPTFKPFPAGAHRVTLEMEVKEVNEKAAISVNFVYKEAVELSDPLAEAPKAGDKANLLCQLDNEYGQGTLKMVADAFIANAAFGVTRQSSRRELMEKSKGAEVVIVTKIRHNKDQDKDYLQLVSMVV